MKHFLHTNLLHTNPLQKAIQMEEICERFLECLSKIIEAKAKPKQVRHIIFLFLKIPDFG